MYFNTRRSQTLCGDYSNQTTNNTTTELEAVANQNDQQRAIMFWRPGKLADSLEPHEQASTRRVSSGKIF